MRMYNGVYTRGMILPNTSKMAVWGKKQKRAPKLKVSAFTGNRLRIEVRCFTYIA